MKNFVVLLLLASAVPAFSADYSGFVPEGCYRTQWQSKWALDTRLTCTTGYALKSVGFKHRMHENGTHQESFQFLCCKNSNVSRKCWWDEDFVSNWELRTNRSKSGSATMIGLRFKHRKHENGTHQQEYRVKWCALKTRLSSCRWTPASSKWSLETEFGCGWGEVMTGIGFSHPLHKNGTHEESISVMCCR